MTAKRKMFIKDKDTETLDADISEKTGNFVHELDKYWPYGLKIIPEGDEPVDTDLLFIYKYEFGGKAYCSYCSGGCFNDPTATMIKKKGIKMYVELDARMRYVNKGKTVEVPFSEHPEAFKTFLADHDNSASFSQILRPKCCNQDPTAFVNVSNNEFTFSNLFRYFYQNRAIYVYLKLDPLSAALIPWELNENFVYILKKSYLKAFWDAEVGKNVNLSDTLEVERIEIPTGFQLSLRDYQLRSINWMKSVESVDHLDVNTIYNDVSYSNELSNLKIKLGHTSYYVGLNGWEEESLTLKPGNRIKSSLKFHSGILADDTGSGKTITTLGFLHSSPFTDEKKVARVKRFKGLNSLHNSRASCVICPENIQLQWMEEARRCNPLFKIVSYATKADADSATLTDLCEADLIVTSYSFLVEQNKHKLCLRMIHFHRIILDEFHELTPASREINSVLNLMRADHIWGLTGTPNFSSLTNILRYFNLPLSLENVVNESVFGRNEFIQKFAKRNEPDLDLPPLETEIISVKLSSSERVIHDWRSERASTRTKLMMCSHYQLSENSSRNVNNFKSLEQAKDLMISTKIREVQLYEEKISKILEKLKVISKMKIPNDPTQINNEITTLGCQLAAFEKALDGVKRNLNYTQSVFKVISEPEGNECKICYDNIPADDLSLLPCSHVFCYPCVMAAISRSCDCPLCRQSLKNGGSDVFRIVSEQKVSSNLPGILKKIDISKYSSKMIALCKYLIELIESDQDSKIILFLQYKDLANFISMTFEKELELNHVRVTGDVEQRQSAIKQFTESKTVRLIMLSSEDSVSGINLTQATHVILLHPFFTGQGEDVDLAYEKQGISRAYRFGLTHPLKVVRFSVQDTIEEEYTLKRKNLKL